MACYLGSKNHYIRVHEIKNDEITWLRFQQSEQLWTRDQHWHRDRKATCSLHRYIMEQTASNKATKIFWSIPSFFLRPKHAKSIHGWNSSCPQRKILLSLPAREGSQESSWFTWRIHQGSSATGTQRLIIVQDTEVGDHKVEGKGVGSWR